MFGGEPPAPEESRDSIDLALDSVATTEAEDSVKEEVKEEVKEVAVIVEESVFLSKEEEVVDPMLLKDQFKWLTQAIRNMKRKKESVLFLVPVDPIALNIPSYSTFVKHPMDISTIEKKISSHQYLNIGKALQDFDLMFENCYTFNGHESAVSLMAKSLQMWFKRECDKMPTTKTIPGIAKRKSLNSKLPHNDLKFCNHILREVVKKQYAHFVWPFTKPVDPILLGIPTYTTIVKRPMDLSTIKVYLDRGEYSTTFEFESDFRLMLENCFLFNAAGTDIHNLGKEMERLFNQKWSERDASEDDDGEDSDSRQLVLLKKQVASLNLQISVLMEKRKEKKETKRRSLVQAPAMSQPKPQKQPKLSKSRNRKKRAHESDDELMPDTDITYEQKRELSDNINILPEDKLPQVFEIIKENGNVNAQEDEEIELDIDSLSKKVLWKLYLFVKKHTRPKKVKLDQKSSESESGSEDEVIRRPKKVSIQPEPQGPAKPTFKHQKVSKSIPVLDLPFRTEKGEVTTLTSNFVPIAPTVTPKAATTKPKYDSVLDSAWEAHENYVKVVEPSIILPTIPPAPTFLRSPSPDTEYDEEPEWMDMQGPADAMEAMEQEFGDVGAELMTARDSYFAIAKDTIDSMSLDDLVTNIELTFDSEEEEEGAI